MVHQKILILIILIHILILIYKSIKTNTLTEKKKHNVKK